MRWDVTDEVLITQSNERLAPVMCSPFHSAANIKLKELEP